MSDEEKAERIEITKGRYEKAKSPVAAPMVSGAAAANMWAARVAQNRAVAEGDGFASQGAAIASAMGMNRPIIDTVSSEGDDWSPSGY